MPKWAAYQAERALGFCALKKTPPTPTALAIVAILLTNDLFELGFVLGGAAGARLGVDDARRFGLAHALAGVGLYRFGGGKFSWLAFRHGKYEYEGELKPEGKTFKA